MTPVRIQRKRTKGWRMPPDTVSVTRPGKWGNPFFIINEEGSPWVTDARDESMPVLNQEVEQLLGLKPDGGALTWEEAERGVIALFRTRCVDGLPDLSQLRGKNLACWCALPAPGEPDICHAAVLLEIANKLTCEAVDE